MNPHSIQQESWLFGPQTILDQAFLEDVDPNLRANLLAEHMNFCESERKWNTLDQPVQLGIPTSSVVEREQQHYTIPTREIWCNNREAHRLPQDFDEVSSLSSFESRDEVIDIDKLGESTPLVALLDVQYDDDEDENAHLSTIKRGRSISPVSSGETSGSGDPFPPHPFHQQFLYHQQQLRLKDLAKRPRLFEPLSLRVSIYEKFIAMYEECLNYSHSHNLVNYVLHPLVQPDVIRLTRAWMPTVSTPMGLTPSTHQQILKPTQMIESIGLDYMIADAESVFQNFPQHFFKFANLKIYKTPSYVKLVVSWILFLQGLPNPTDVTTSGTAGFSESAISNVQSSIGESDGVAVTAATTIPHESSGPSSTISSSSSSSSSHSSSSSSTMLDVRPEEFLSEEVTDLPPELEDDQDDDEGGSIKDISDWVAPLDPQLQQQPRAKLVGYNTIFFDNDGKITQIWSDYTTVMY